MHNECPNLGSITDIKGKDMPKTDIFTYSFPCTDLSKAGQQKGLNTSTRSGLIFEVLRLLHEMQEHNKLPQVLIMENVVDLVQVKFIEQWKEIQFEIEQMGYTNYTFTMNAKNYGVAQNRDRVFMVSILGDYYYELPTPIKLEKKLKDYLEQDVDDSYKINEKLLNIIKNNVLFENDTYIQFKQKGHYEQLSRVWKTISPTLHTKSADILIKDKKINVLLNSKNKRLNLTALKIKENETQFLDCYNQITHKDFSGAITTRVDASNSSFLYENMQIRKLTPRECWRLMGIDDSYFDKASQVVNKSQLYKQAGNGIVVDVFAHILKELL
jgi:DNA (cytosine-5)-methyltransferase 1